MIDAFCWWLVTILHNRVRIIHVQGKPYLLRCYLKHGGILPGIYLHYFYVGDEERHLHNHPWKKSWSFILTEGYVEERLDRDEDRWPWGTTYHDRKPLTWNKIGDNDFHRVILRGGNPWTIFISGKKNKDWGFYDVETQMFTSHLDYFETKQETGLVTDSAGNPATLRD